MATLALTAPVRPAADQAVIVKAVTVIIGTVVGLTFTFGFGNVLTLALRLGVLIWVAPLIAPAVDLSILGLLLGTRHLALHGATVEQLQSARGLLIFASLTTLALNVADPLVTGAYGKAAFDAVGPLLLIGWAEVGPGFLQAISAIGGQAREIAEPARTGPVPADQDRTPSTGEIDPDEDPVLRGMQERRRSDTLPAELLARARKEDAAHRAVHQRPISADRLRTRLGIGAERSRRLVAVVRSEVQAQTATGVDGLDFSARTGATAQNAWPEPLPLGASQFSKESTSLCV